LLDLRGPTSKGKEGVQGRGGARVVKGRRVGKGGSERGEGGNEGGRKGNGRKGTGRGYSPYQS